MAANHSQAQERHQQLSALQRAYLEAMVCQREVHDRVCSHQDIVDLLEGQDEMGGWIPTPDLEILESGDPECWRPVLKVRLNEQDWFLGLPVWFETEKLCKRFIVNCILGLGLSSAPGAER